MAATCEAITTIKPENGAIRALDETLAGNPEDGDYVLVSCDTDYVLTPTYPIRLCECTTTTDASGNGVTTCSYSGETHTCVQQCSTPDMPSNAVAEVTSLKTTYDADKEISLKCPDGYRVKNVDISCQSSTYTFKTKQFNCEEDLSNLETIYKTHPEWIFIPVAILILLLILLLVFLILYICARAKAKNRVSDSEEDGKEKKKKKKESKKKFTSLGVQNYPDDGVGRVLIYSRDGSTRFYWLDPDTTKDNKKDHGSQKKRNNEYDNTALPSYGYDENYRSATRDDRDSLVFENGATRGRPRDPTPEGRRPRDPTPDRNMYLNPYENADENVPLREVATPQLVPRMLDMENDRIEADLDF